MEQIGGNHLVDGDEPSAMNTLSEVGKLHRHLQPHEETTEWDDILRKHGIKPPDPVKEENKRAPSRHATVSSPCSRSIRTSAATGIEAEVKRIVEEEAANYDPHAGTHTDTRAHRCTYFHPTQLHPSHNRSRTHSSPHPTQCFVRKLPR